MKRILIEIYSVPILIGHAVLVLLIANSPLNALEPWPLDAQWVALKNKDWLPLTDPSDEPQGYVDVVSDAKGYAAYVWASATSVFFRLPLRTTPLKQSTELLQFAWSVGLDADNNNSPDWTILVGGITETLRTFYNPAVDNDPEVKHYEVVNPLITGDVRAVSGGYATFPNLTYLDFQVPYTALQVAGYGRNVTSSTPVKVFLTTSTTEQLSIKDAAGPSTTIAGAFANSATITFGGLAVGTFGFLYDTRDPNPYTGQGIWFRGETVTVSGMGWPSSTSTYYNSGIRNVRILNSLSAVVWSGTITTDANGNVASASTWTIDKSSGPGIYTLAVQDPTTPDSWYVYDTFTIQTPAMSISKTASKDSVVAGSVVTYTIKVSNNGNANGSLTTVVDTLPTGFTYVPGSTSGLTTANPTISGQQLTWSGTWTVGQPAGSVTLTFRATAGLSRGLYQDNASANGTNFNPVATGNTAPVRVLAPSLTLLKQVDKATAAPGETLTYSVTYSNTGDADAMLIVILDSVPTFTTYVKNSAAGTGMTILYSHNGGATYDASQTVPVTDLSFQRATALSPGQNSTIIFQVIID